MKFKKNVKETLFYIKGMYSYFLQEWWPFEKFYQFVIGGFKICEWQVEDSKYMHGNLKIQNMWIWQLEELKYMNDSICKWQLEDSNYMNDSWKIKKYVNDNWKIQNTLCSWQSI